ncbi:MAG TPA: molybdate ABC transporter substrate-binding protein [Polyangiaceae bacterium]|nr:molybdate ABC transporter substrate-binding protein [Polyangiaceae bacterium]
MAPPADGDARWVPALLLSTTLLGGCKQAATVSHEPVRVAAAADLTLAFEELGGIFEARTGHKVSLSFGASGALAKQLSQGAPFDLFAAANSSFVDDAVKAGACDGATKALYARGHIVIWTRAEGPGVRSLSDLASPEIKRISIANPEHAPYGKAAREALGKAGLWPAVEAKIVQAENVRQALQFAETGNVDAAIVALSLVAQNEHGQQLAVDPTLHAPINQTLVVCRHGKNESGARAFAQLVESSEGQALLQRYGFGGSGEQVAQ